MNRNLLLQTITTPREERRPTVFISYCREDKEHVDRLIADLKAAGYDCWIDTSSIKGGEEWAMAIADGIIKSDALVPVVTAKSLCHKWVKREILFAQKIQKPIIPWVLEDVHQQKESFLLTDYQWIMLFDCHPAVAFSRLLEALPSPDLQMNDSNPRDSQRRVEMVYLERLGLEELVATERYTPMSGASERKVQPAEMRSIFELLPMSKERQAQQERRRFENAVEEILKIRRAVLLGEAGGGKTTTIWKLAADLVHTALQDAKAPIPLLIRLGRWTDADQTLPEFIAAQLGELGDYLDVLLTEKRAALLLDGLNELPASQRKDKYEQVRLFIQQNPNLLAVVSCRELDYTIDLGFDLINITPLDPIRIKEFAGRYLGENQGESLFWRIAGGDEVQKLWAIWQNAGASFDLFWNAPDIPKENPDVYNKTTGEHDRIWLEKVRGKHSLMELARNPYMLLMLTSVYAEQGTLPENRGGLFELFVQTLLKREGIPSYEQTFLTNGLAKVAYEMQIRRAPEEQTTDDEVDDELEDAEADAGNALTVLPRQDVADVLGERLLYLAGSASILSVGEQVRFTHQLLQEYFAAKFMDGEIRVGRLKAADIWRPESWWERTNWEEAAVLLAGLYSDDCSSVVEWVAEANPEVAAQCVVRSGAGLAEAIRERLRAKWIPRLTDLKRDPEPLARAAVGRALAITGWDNRKGVGVVDGLPDIDWIRIPEGEFQYGDENEEDNTPQKHWLPEFHISRYPITYNQFQTFLDDPEGFNDPGWFKGLKASEEERQMREQSFKFENHPRETVNWYQAMAFCRWLSWRLGGKYDLKKVADWKVRLPTEFEWEKAARGTDGRLYPYGNRFDAAKGNTYEAESRIGQTSAVGIFPNGASPYGVEEMSGNVWEWCLSDYYKPQIEARKENLRKADWRVLRGGSWFFFLDFARAVFRNCYLPADHNDLIGFRVVLCRPPSF